jgi:hypothetical protein
MKRIMIAAIGAASTIESSTAGRIEYDRIDLRHGARKS